MVMWDVWLWIKKDADATTGSQLLDDPRHHIVIVRLSNLRTIKRPWHQRLMRPEVINQHLAIDLRRMQRSPSLPQHSAFAFLLIFCCSFISLRRRASIARFGTFNSASSSYAAAPSSSEYENTPSQSIFAAEINASSCLKSSSVSPGNPTIKLVRSTIPGTVARAFSINRRKTSGAPPRFIRFSTLGLACCSGTSRYFAILSCRAIVSSSRVVTLFGYAYKNRSHF